MQTPPVGPPSKPLRKTKDLEHGTILVASGIRLLGVEPTPTHKLFVFEDDPRIDVILAQFLSGDLMLNARDLFKIWRSLRSMTFEATPRR